MEYIKIGDKSIGFKSKAGNEWCKETCYICGKHFQKGEELVVVICPYEFKLKYKNLNRNKIVHVDEVNELINKSTTFEEFWDYFGNIKKPRKEKLTEEQEKRIEIFIDAAYNKGYRYSTKKSNGTVSCKKNGSSDRVEYNVYSDNISYFNKRKKGFGDVFVERGFVTQVYNEFHRLLNDGKRDDYDAIKAFSNCLNSAIETTNRIMGE